MIYLCHSLSFLNKLKKMLYWQNTFQCRLIKTCSPHNHIKASHIRRNVHSFLAKISHVALIAKKSLKNMLNYKSPVVVNDVTLCLKIFQGCSFKKLYFLVFLKICKQEAMIYHVNHCGERRTMIKVENSSSLGKMKLLNVTRVCLFCCLEDSGELGIMLANKLLSTFVVWDKVLTWKSDVHSTRANFKGREYRPAVFSDTFITFLQMCCLYFLYQMNAGVSKGIIHK